MYWKAEYIFLIIFSTLTNYYTSLKIENTDNKNKKKLYLIVSLVTNLGILFFFKYFNFLLLSLKSEGFFLFQLFNIEIFDLDNIDTFYILLPVGISFYTFQSLGYSIDVYQGKCKAEKHLGKFALYVSFFPQLVAGPIERSTNLIPQFYKKHHFDYQRVSDGLKLMLWGFFKKIVIADRLAIYVNQVYNYPDDYQGLPIIFATYFFAFQIFCDFSGYTDIAIGAAQVMGFRLMNNFNCPYFSKSVVEFWKRWHISLSTWFRDYLYIPLGGNRVEKWRWYYNLFIVFLISGLWHGANWTFVFWGAIHGLYILFSIWTKNLREKVSNFFHLNKVPLIQKCFKIFITFHLICFAWIFFRANSVEDAFLLIQNMFNIDAITSQIFEIKPFQGTTIGRYEIIIGIISVLLMELIHIFQNYKPMSQFFSEKPIWLRWSVYYAGVLSILMFGIFEKNEFIYFQF